MPIWDARRKGEDFEDTAIRLNAESLMPVGELGGLWQKQYQISAKNVDAELIRSNKRRLNLMKHTLTTWFYKAPSAIFTNAAALCS